MANFKKMDDHDFVFVNKPLTPKEDKEFSEFLKSRKLKAKAKRNSKTAASPKISLAFFLLQRDKVQALVIFRNINS